jgi:hypothetical protein
MRQLIICVVGTVGCIVAQTTVDLRPPPPPPSASFRAVVERFNMVTGARATDGSADVPPNVTIPGAGAPLEVVLSKVPAAGWPITFVYQSATLGVGDRVNLATPVTVGTTELQRRTVQAFIADPPRQNGGQADILVVYYLTAET